MKLSERAKIEDRQAIERRALDTKLEDKEIEYNSYRQDVSRIEDGVSVFVRKCNLQDSPEARQGFNQITNIADQQMQAYRRELEDLTDQQAQLRHRQQKELDK